VDESRAVARVAGELGLEIGFQQLSELLPVQGIAHITSLPPAVQKVSSFAAGVAASSPDRARARSAIEFLASPAAAQAITNSGLEPMV
jgi:molybdate transport system substrate-binding protein